MSRRGSAESAFDGVAPSGGQPSPVGAGSPPAVRPPRSRWRDPRLVLGIVVVAACALVGARVVDGANDTVEVWTAAHALSAGQPIATSDLVRREFRFAEQTDADHYLSGDRPVPTGATLARDVGAGELLPRTALSTGAVGAVTEVPLSVGAEAVPSTVHVGDVVDVWVTPDTNVRDTGSSSGPGQPRSTLLFDDVTVVAAPRSATSLGPSSTRQVIVGVAEDQEGRLPTALAALASGTVILTSQR